MLASALWTLLFSGVAMAPGIVLGRGIRFGLGGLAALATASLAVSMIVTALTAAAVFQIAGATIPVWLLMPVSMVLTGGSLWLTRGRQFVRPKIEPAGAVVTITALLYAYLIYTAAIAELPDGSLRIHAWYNADWFKHVGHTYGLANLGLPARDIFGAGNPLRYYWLAYLLPGSGTALGGDAWAALYTANAIFSALLVMTLFGVIRMLKVTDWTAAAVTGLAFVICSALNTWPAVFDAGMYNEVMFGVEAPIEPALVSLLLYIPQHALALAILLAWAILALDSTPETNRLRLLAIAALATVMTISTLFGAAILAAYGFTELFRRGIKAVPELAALAVISIVLVFALGVVPVDAPITSSVPDSSKVFGVVETAGPLDRALKSILIVLQRSGLPALLCIYVLFRWKPQSTRDTNVRLFALSLLFTSFIGAIASELILQNLMAHEVRLRVVNLVGVAVAISAGMAAAWACSGETRHRIGVALGLGLVALAAAPTAIIRTLWHFNANDRFVVTIPRDDRVVLGALRQSSGKRDTVWQYPEQPFLAGGGDSWSAIFAGKVDIAATRATDGGYANARVDRARRYFSGSDTQVPADARWIYLSRALHAGTYDTLVARLAGDPAWAKTACLRDACLFRKVAAHTDTVPAQTAARSSG